MTAVDIAALLAQALGETLFMVTVATALAIVIGVPLGIAVVLTDNAGLRPNAAAHQVLSAVINIGRSLPFIILLIVVGPLTRLIVGTTIGATAAIVPLSLAAAPFLARLVETSLREIPRGKIDAVVAMGASLPQLVRHVFLPEALPSLVAGTTVTYVALIGYSAMAGAIGGGGLGDVAIRYGYQRFDVVILLWTVVVLILLTQLVQLGGDRLTRRLTHR